MALLAKIPKQPAEIFPITIEYLAKLPTGVNLLSGVASATKRSDQSDATGTVLVSPTVTVTGTQGAIIVQAGDDGEDYDIEFTMTLDAGPPYILEDEIRLEVNEI